MVSVVYFDTSALLKRYVTEVGSAWVRESMVSANGVEIFTSSLTTVEATCAFARRFREGILDTDAYVTIERALDYDIRYRYNILEVTPATLETAQSLARRHPLRAYDAVHLATAWLVNQVLLHEDKAPLTFICADERLLAIAEAERLLSENPNRYA